MPHQNELHFHVGDMTCNHCVQTLTKAIEQAIPGAHVTGDLDRKTITITGTTEKARVAQIIKEEGYTPEAA